MARVIQEAQGRLSTGSTVNSPEAAVIAGVSVATRTAYPVGDLLVGASRRWGPGGHSMGNIFRGWCDLCGSPMVQGRETVIGIVEVTSGERRTREEPVLAPRKRLRGQRDRRYWDFV